MILRNALLPDGSRHDIDLKDGRVAAFLPPSPGEALGLDAIGDVVALGPVRYPGQAEKGLVEMDVAVDQRRQDEAERLAGRGRQEGRDAAVLQVDVMA